MYLTKHQNILTLALYRLTGCKDNLSPYVITNPDPKTILTDKDVIFILSQFTPGKNSFEWGAPFEEKEHVYKRNLALETSRTSTF